MIKQKCFGSYSFVGGANTFFCFEAPANQTILGTAGTRVYKYRDRRRTDEMQTNTEQNNVLKDASGVRPWHRVSSADNGSAAAVRQEVRRSARNQQPSTNEIRE
jgi:hypothetical protein